MLLTFFITVSALENGNLMTFVDSCSGFNTVIIWFALQQREEHVRLEMSTASAQRAAFLSKHGTANCSFPASVTFKRTNKTTNNHP